MDVTRLEYSVLFVEDDIEVKNKVSSRLRRYFNNVYEAEDGEKGWELYKQYKPEILFLDINVPKLSGIELIQRIRENDHTTKAVMLTAHSDVEYLMQVSGLRLSKYIIKPLSRQILDETIKLLINEFSRFQTTNIKTIVLKEGFIWHCEKNELFKDGIQIHLTVSEKKVLEFLLSNINTSVSFDDLILYVWDSFDQDKKESLKTIVKTLRKKLPKDTIINVFAQGYKIEL